MVPTSTGVSAAVAMIEGLGPANEIEAALAIDIACLHAAVTNVLSRLGSHSMERRTAIAANAAAKLERALHSALKSYDLLKQGHRQVIRIERLEIQPGAQAVVGQVVSGRS